MQGVPMSFEEEEALDALNGRKRKQSKDSATYGVFAEESSEDEEDKTRRRKDYAKPMLFTQAPKAGEQQQEDPAAVAFKGFSQGPPDQPQEEEEEEGDSYREMMPMSFLTKQEARQRRVSEDAEAKAAAKRKKRKAPVDVPMAAPQGMDSERMAELQAVSTGTKGFGLKMLLKMGFKGELGKTNKASYRPIEVKLRKKGQGLQDDGERTEQAKRDFPSEADKEETAKEEAQKVAADAALKAKRGRGSVPATAWKKGSKASRQKVVYKTVQQLREEAAARGREAGGTVAARPQIVIDMRGAQARTVVDLQELNAAPEESASQMEELRYNTRLLLETSEFEIQETDRKLQARKVQLSNQLERRQKLEALVHREAQAMDKVRTVLELVKQLQASALATAPAQRKLDQMALTLGRLRKDFAQEYVIYGLQGMAAPLVRPCFKQVFGHSWSPLAEPLHGVEQARVWRRIFCDDEAEEGAAPLGFSAAGGAFSRDGAAQLSSMVGEPLLGRLRRCVANDWDPRQPASLVALVGAWRLILSADTVDNILDQLVLPKLRRTVEHEWNPTAETVAIDTWLHPWRELMGARLLVLYPAIRFKLGSALQQWHASDASAHTLLAPWCTVWSAADWSSFTLKYVVPKLVAVLRELHINPRAQQLEPFGWVQRWEGVLPSRIFVSLVAHEFMYKWLGVLHGWLSKMLGLEAMGDIEQWCTCPPPLARTTVSQLGVWRPRRDAELPPPPLAYTVPCAATLHARATRGRAPVSACACLVVCAPCVPVLPVAGTRAGRPLWGPSCYTRTAAPWRACSTRPVVPRPRSREHVEALPMRALQISDSLFSGCPGSPARRPGTGSALLCGSMLQLSPFSRER